MTARRLEAGVLGVPQAAGGPAELAEAGGVSDGMGPSLSAETLSLLCFPGLLVVAVGAAGTLSSSSLSSAAAGHGVSQLPWSISLSGLVG